MVGCYQQTSPSSCFFSYIAFIYWLPAHTVTYQSVCEVWRLWGPCKLGIFQCHFLPITWSPTCPSAARGLHDISANIHEHHCRQDLAVQRGQYLMFCIFVLWHVVTNNTIQEQFFWKIWRIYWVLSSDIEQHPVKSCLIQFHPVISSKCII